jgi:hypothetical protein
MVSQWFVSAAGLAAVSKGHHRDSKPGEPTCRWQIPIVSKDRDFDFTECFETVVLLPAPLLLALLIALAQIFSVTRRLRRTGPGCLDWTTRSSNNERVAKIKTVS